MDEKRVEPNRRKAKIKRGSDNRGQAQHIHEGNKTHLQHENENPQLASGEKVVNEATRTSNNSGWRDTVGGSFQSQPQFQAANDVCKARCRPEDARATNELQTDVQEQTHEQTETKRNKGSANRKVPCGQA